MLRPLFSASHSAHLENRARETVTEHPALVRWNRQMGVPGAAFGAIWGPQAEIWETDAVYAPSDSEDEARTTTTTQEHDDQHELDKRARRGSHSSHAPSINSHPDETIPLPPSQPLPPSTMANKTRLWVSVWFLISIPLIFWDAGYCFFRPRSMTGGDLHWIWSPYSLYQEIDYVYGLRAFENGEGFTNAQSFLNLIENFMNIFYLYLAHVQNSPLAPLLGFASVVMTVSKTVLYWLQEYYCGFCSIGHNDFYTIVVYWIIPNGAWIVVPSMIMVEFAKDIASALLTVDGLQKNKGSTKKQQ